MITLSDQHQYNVERGPAYEDESALPSGAPDRYDVRFIAYYLPQFHPVSVNDHAWGRGFTEWTNVTRALPRYLGHYQPRLPADLGFYDLRAVDTFHAQAALAARGGVYGFCIHDYWFDGTKTLSTPLELILANPDIKLRFCLNWANESWSRRWDGSDHEMILEQNYSAAADTAYARSLLPAAADPRYIRVEGRPLVMIYRPGLLPDPAATIDRWREVFVREGLPNPYVLMSEAFDGADPRPWGIDATAGFPPHKFFEGGGSLKVRRLDPLWRGGAKSYEQLVEDAIAGMARDYPFHPGVCPGWDNEARKPRRGTSFYGATPAAYGRWLRAARKQAAASPDPDRRIVFINAWNEWAEGAYLEPDRHFGHAYLAETARALADAEQSDSVKARSTSSRFETRETFGNSVFNRGWTAARRLHGLLSSRRG